MQTWQRHTIFHDHETYTFPRHADSGEIYNLDPENLIRVKCAGLTILTPTVTVIRMVYWLAASLFMSFAEGYRYLDGEEINEKNISHIKETLSDVPRALYYGIALTAYACEGILFPLSARRKYGQAERMLNRHVDGPHRDKYYLALCFQPIKKLVPHIEKIKAIKKAFWSCDYQQLMKVAK